MPNIRFGPLAALILVAGATSALGMSALGTSALGETALPVIAGNAITGVRNARYCEIIPVVRDGLHLTATVYNTLGLNDCPAPVWDAITEDAMKKRFGAVTVLLNGPRHFLMDQITASGATKAGETIEAGGLKLTERATIDVGLLDLLHRPYREQTIDRETVYLFKAGSPVFMLEGPGGNRYVMQLCRDRRQDVDLCRPANSRREAQVAVGLAL